MLPIDTLIRLVVKPDGRVKARIVVDGSCQEADLDYDPTDIYAPVMDRVSHRMLLAIAASYRCYVHTIDVTQAFLNGGMTETLFVRMPKGITDANGQRSIHQLRRSLYGIKQAPVIWQRALGKTLNAFGLTATKSDPCVFFRRDGSDFLFIGVYVDDLLIISTNERMLIDFKERLVKAYKVRDQGPIDGTSYLGMKTHYDRDSGILHVSNDVMTRKILKKFGFDSAAPADSPAVQDGARDNSPSSSPFAIRSFIGAMTYLTSTVRPDLALAVNSMACTASDPPTVSDGNRRDSQ